MRCCYKIILPVGYVKSQKKEFELFIRAPQSVPEIGSESLREVISTKLNIPLENVIAVSESEYAEVERVDTLPPTQLRLF